MQAKGREAKEAVLNLLSGALAPAADSEGSASAAHACDGSSVVPPERSEERLRQLQAQAAADLASGAAHVDGLPADWAADFERSAGALSSVLKQAETVVAATAGGRESDLALLKEGGWVDEKSHGQAGEISAAQVAIIASDLSPALASLVVELADAHARDAATAAAEQPGLALEAAGQPGGPIDPSSPSAQAASPGASGAAAAEPAGPAPARPRPGYPTSADAKPAVAGDAKAERPLFSSLAKILTTGSPRKRKPAKPAGPAQSPPAGRSKRSPRARALVKSAKASSPKKPAPVTSSLADMFKRPPPRLPAAVQFEAFQPAEFPEGDFPPELRDVLAFPKAQQAGPGRATQLIDAVLRELSAAAAHDSPPMNGGANIPLPASPDSSYATSARSTPTAMWDAKALAASAAVTLPQSPMTPASATAGGTSELGSAPGSPAHPHTPSEDTTLLTMDLEFDLDDLRSATTGMLWSHVSEQLGFRPRSILLEGAPLPNSRDNLAALGLTESVSVQVEVTHAQADAVERAAEYTETAQ
ncbi:hypothetical protein FNF27_07232 [Cafeteria roenbergensis]|uniref:Uncharacterized protein n=2 Tax=Cafeteria roenbergensis TaxID=33653 RepID=A0A5A8DR62_CAFRO|nr:hypothetical protein FNF27_07232 [Cafeteria roenbergensis]